jgi:uncharacterized OsmC-like protein
MKDINRQYPATVSSRITEQQKTQLHELAWENRCTISEFLRKIIIHTLNKKT